MFVWRAKQVDCVCVTLSLSVFSAGMDELLESEYLTVSVCVHPLLCMIVKKHCHLLWIGKEFVSINHFVDLFTKARCFDPKRAFFGCQKHKTNHCTT